MAIPRPDLDLVIQLYAAALPHFDFVLRCCESEKRWVRFSPRFYELIALFKCQNYPELYQDEARIQTAFWRAFYLHDDDIKHDLEKFASSPLEERTQFINECFQESINLSQFIDDNVVHVDDLDWSPEGRAKADLEWAKLPPDEQQQIQRFLQYMLLFGIATFFNFFAVMVHGRKLTQLVREAMEGDDESFCLAIHIDKSILNQIPYFRERYQRGQQNGEQDFLKAVGDRIQQPQLQGRIKHRLLYLLFAILEGTHWLADLKHREILDICEHVGLDRYGILIETENALTKRLNDYRDFQKSNQKSMP
jgi:hypothetical protein